MTTEENRGMGLALILLSLWLLFYALGRAALFEPDEGRHAEMAREIIMLKDWVTPRYNFIPRLDKPVFYDWLMAAAYKVFGISEWSARLPSALAAFGLVLLTCIFARSRTGLANAWWSGLILLTCVEILALARTAIPDMVLSFFMTLSLCSFFWGSRAERKRAKRSFYFLTYGAMGIATLAKGPIGVLLPGLVIFCYLGLGRKWPLLREMNLALGVTFFAAMVAPWYLIAELRNPGYLGYFLWDEHFLRYFTPQFHRSQPWYYFFAVVAAGFLPWTLILPLALNDLRKKTWDDQTLYLAVWTVLPLLFFSLSDSKLPHYVLPVYPPLSILTGKFLAKSAGDQTKKWLFALPWLTLVPPLLLLVVAFSRPDLLPQALQRSLDRVLETISLLPIVSGLLVSLLSLLALTLIRTGGGIRYLVICAGVALLSFFTIEPIRAQVSFTRSSKELAARSSVFILPDDRVVIYDAYLASLPFYLRIDRPLWIVQAEGKDTVMGSLYVGKRQLQLRSGDHQMVFNYAQFSELWRTSAQRLMVFVHAKRLHRLKQDTGGRATEISRTGDVLLVSNREAKTPGEGK